MSKKVLIFCPYYPPHIGGLESHADEFNKYLSKEGYDITVFTPLLPEDADEFETKYNGVKIIRFPAFELIANWPVPKFWQIKFWKLFIGLFWQDFDVVVSRTRFFLTSLMALFFLKIKKVKWIHIEHGSDFVRLNSNFSSFLAWVYDQVFGRLVFNSCNQNIAISRAVEKFINKFDKRSIQIIYRGIELKEIDKIKEDIEIRKKYKNKIIILFLGRLYKWKGVENSIKAFGLLPDDLKNKIVFLIMGDGEDRKRLEIMANKIDFIEFLGDIEHSRAISILKSSDIYIHSAMPGGGLSTSLLEAIYCKNIIISTPNEGASELDVKKNNIKRSDAKMIAIELERILSNIVKYKKNVEYNNDYIIKNFYWGKSIKKYIGLI